MQFTQDFFKPEIREGFEIPAMMKRAWAAQMEVLQVVADICEENSLQYFADWGTLLGAVRHQGFIPWDDDIDICLKREDYNHLVSILSQQLPHGFVMAGMYAGTKRLQMAAEVPQLRVMADETLWDFNDYMKYFHGFPYQRAGIDIFPLDGMPDDEKIIAKKFKKIKFYKTILLTAYSEMGKGATWYAALAKRVLIPICKHLNTEKLCNKLNAISKEYPIDKSPYVGGFLWGYGPQEKMPKEFLEPVEVEFEGHMFPAPKCWDFYLTQLYGDYMQLPPENKRISHDFNVYMKENKE